MKQPNYSRKHRRDVLILAYSNGAAKAQADTTSAILELGNAFDAVALKVDRSLTVAQQARQLEDLLCQALSHPEWLIGVRLAPAAPPQAEKAKLQALLARVDRRIGVLEQAAQRLEASKMQRAKILQRLSTLRLVEQGVLAGGGPG